jgi:hypothetical protein
VAAATLVGPLLTFSLFELRRQILQVKAWDTLQLRNYFRLLILHTLIISHLSLNVRAYLLYAIETASLNDLKNKPKQVIG